ncbi:MAG: FtsX-like permease family protein [Chitinivibrionales bacterium]|nr:FtsX-like permease family protein [Chitinivibrionales bacterium]
MHAKRDSTAASMRQMEHEYVHIGHRMGYDISLVPADAIPSASPDRASSLQTMPDSTVTLVAESAAIDHLLPRLVAMLAWTERNRDVMLMGIGNERISERAREQGEKPFSTPPPSGFVHVGSAIADECELSVGRRITLNGVTLTVAECLAESGSRNDAALWVSLADAQRIVGRTGRITDMLGVAQMPFGELQAHMLQVAPSVRLVRHGRRVQVRGKLVDTARVIAHDMVEMEHRHHTALAGSRNWALAVLLLATLLGCAAWVAVVSYVNTRQRREEIGVLRTVGVRLRTIVVLFAVKGCLLTVLGTASGLALGIAATALLGGGDGPGDAPLIALGVCGVMALAVAAYAVPAVRAAARNPADVLWSP